MRKIASPLLILVLIFVTIAGLSFDYAGDAEDEANIDPSFFEAVYIEYTEEPEIELENAFYAEIEEASDLTVDGYVDVSTLFASKTLVEVDDPVYLYWIPSCDTALYLVIWDDTLEPIGGTLQSAETNSISMSFASEGVFSFTIYLNYINNGIATLTRGNTVTVIVSPNTITESSTLSVDKTEFVVGEECVFRWTSVPGADTYTLVRLYNPFDENAGGYFVQQAYLTTSSQVEYVFNAPGIFTYRIVTNHSAGKMIEGNLVTVTVSLPHNP